LITDAHALAAVPPSGWLRRYVDHALKQTTAPAAYHVAFGLACLASSASPDLCSRYAGTLHGNFYALAIGRSGDDQKSSALRVAREILWHADPKMIGKMPGSWEGLIDALAETPRQTLFYSEFGDFLAKANNPGYFGPMKTTLTDLWDCLDAATEVLTPGGWRGLDHVGAFSRVLAWCPETQRLAWETPTAQGARPVRPGEQMIAFRNGVVDLRCTEGHHVFCAAITTDHRHGLFGATTAGALLGRRGRIVLPLAGLPPVASGGDPVPGRGCPLTWAAELSGVPLRPLLHVGGAHPKDRIRADRLGRLIGWAAVRGLPPDADGPTLRLRGLNARRVDLVGFLLRSLDLTAIATADGWDVHADADAPALAAVLRAAATPRDRIGALGSLPIGAFDAVRAGIEDAARVANSYVAVSPDLAADLAAIGIVQGYSSSTIQRPGAETGHRAVWFRFQDRATITTHPSRASGPRFTAEAPAEGERVWCLTVPSGALIVRRGGRVYVIGNCTPQDRVKAKGRGAENTVTVPNPRLSLIGGCSLSYLMTHTSRPDWEGGFLGRFFFVHARRERVDPDPQGDPTAIKPLAAELAARASLATVPPCLGLTPAAADMWRDWFFALDGAGFPEVISGAKTRMPTMARKIAMLLAWDFGTALQGTPWHLGETEIGWALQLTGLHIASVIALAEQVVEHPEARLRRDVLDCIPIGDYRTFGQVLERTKMPYKKIKEVLDGLTYEGRVQPVALPQSSVGTGGMYYQRVR